MTRIAAIWAGLGDDAEANDWYRDKQIPAAVKKIESTARNAERKEENVFQEVTHVEGRHMTIYDLPDGPSEEELEAQIRPALEEIPGDAQLKTRCYREYANWFGEDWRGDSRDVQMWAVVLWQPVPEAHDELLDWYVDEFIPGMFESPELLRARIFKLERATNIRGQKHGHVDKESLLQYMTIWEYASDELPWEVLVYLGSSERWRHYVEGHYMKWEIAQYLVTRKYSKTGGNDPAIRSTASL
ncbi:hypothetical protein ACJQWK_01839 [Exserohilum turcicum]|uniref:Uncharacterized protein n=1 Tax=Exserohilum turcicum (strain 28A) TaxID=671987 RepID=R0IU04_EXST2|nr:uncharacterized protein SETTUDRAFT_38944 [Exserohilum turcica Et28A]EOA88280.1 hypothetical protein SETTUDRAFT_38944 [Exserohilum turcica Et28A]